MKFFKRNGKPMPKHVVEMAEEVKKNGTAVSRREFITTASAFGATAVTAYAMLGMKAPARAAAHAKAGGTLRFQQEVRALKDPRTYDWSQIANVSRGWLEYLVQFNNDATFTPKLLEGWEISDDATTYVLKVRKGVKWNDGSDFTAEDVARNIEGWCDKSVEGNSMAARFSTLIDAKTDDNPNGTDKIKDGVLEIVDSHTVKLNLPAADITLIPGMADYPAAITHKDYNFETAIEKPLGTGPYIPEAIEVGVKAVLVKNTNHTWWNEGNGAWLDRIEFIDYGQEPAAWVAAAESDEVDSTYSIEGEFIDIFAALDGWKRADIDTASTIVIRPNQNNAPYDNVNVRRALALAVDNNVLLELGIAGLGITANNTHVGPMHPEYVDIGAPEYNPEKAKQMMDEAGAGDFEHEIISIDAGYRKDTTDAVADQLRKAGIKVKRTVLPGSTFWNDWAKYPFSSTNWNPRPLGVQVLALAYRSGEAWNESGFANKEFDDTLTEALAIADVEKRKVKMQRLMELMRDEGVTIQPYWRTLTNFSKDTVGGADHHISYEYYPHEMHFKA
ncbi:MAG: ABC transporter substrate-binding protein [Ahrensia sp.]|nr:ABC transporter substrate-binding protein [Ahrensia sp.]